MGILVNGNGNPHVYAHQDSDLIAGIVGNQTSIMPVGDKFEANQEDANTIALSSGVIITKEGRRIQLDAGTIDEFIIPTGAQDVQSFYIIGYHLYEDGNSDQLCETFVRKMDSASDTIPESTFRSGATEVFVSLYRVTQDSLNITDIDLLLPYADSIAEVKRNGGNKNLAAIEDGSTASQPYVKGEFVIVGGQFCEVTASISTNDAFIAYPLPNYNIKAGTVGEQISDLNQNLTTRYNQETKYWQYKYNGVWYNDHYVDPTFDGNVLALLANSDYVTKLNNGGVGASGLTHGINVTTSSQFQDWIQVTSSSDNIRNSFAVICNKPFKISDSTSASWNISSATNRTSGTATTASAWATIFITDTLEIPDWGNNAISASSHVAVVASLNHDSSDAKVNQMIKSLVSSKFSDWTKDYYIGVSVDIGWTNFRNTLTVNQLDLHLG